MLKPQRTVGGDQQTSVPNIKEATSKVGQLHAQLPPWGLWEAFPHLPVICSPFFFQLKGLAFSCKCPVGGTEKLCISLLVLPLLFF